MTLELRQSITRSGSWIPVQRPAGIGSAWRRSLGWLSNGLSDNSRPPDAHTAITLRNTFHRQLVDVTAPARMGRQSCGLIVVVTTGTWYPAGCPLGATQRPCCSS